MSNSALLKSSIARKFAMALSALFLMVFLLQHFVINLTSVISADTFNEISHFMGTNFAVQYIMQPILIFGVVFHFVMGFVLELKNKSARQVKYAMNKGGANSTWMSRNMILSGLVILAFVALHFVDFWFPEINTKFIQGNWTGMGHEGLASGEYRYFHELQEKFESIARVIAYCVAFVFLSLHLMHGFNSAFQSMGQNNKYTKGMKKFGVAFSVIIPLGFIAIALFHHLTQCSH